MKDVINEENFEYFNLDINLLIINILLEGFYRNQNIFTLDQFVKGNYWDIEEVKQNMIDTNDYPHTESLVIHQLFYIIKDLDLGKINRVSVNDIDGTLESVIKQIVLKKDGTDEDVGYLSAVIEEIFNLKKIKEKEMAEQEKTRKEFNYQFLGRIDFTNDDYYKHLDLLLSETPEYIEIEIASFNDENMKKLHKMSKDFICSFSQDDYVDKKPTYQEKRFYFSKQLENFYEYIKKLPMIDGFINLPFSSLQETGFEIIKILSYLENEKKIKVRNWNDENLWNVKFHTTPLSLESVIASGPNNKRPTNKERTNEGPVKYEQSILYFQGKEIDFRNKQNQKELLVTLFKNKTKNWSYDEIQEVWDEEMAKKLIKYPENYWRKFYTAGDSINQAIAVKTQTEDFIIKDTKEIRINPKYV